MVRLQRREYTSAIIADTFGKPKEWLIMSVSVPNVEAVHHMKKTKEAFLGIE